MCITALCVLHVLHMLAMISKQEISQSSSASQPQACMRDVSLAGSVSHHYLPRDLQAAGGCGRAAG